MIAANLQYVVKQRVASVTLTRPETLNLLTEGILHRLRERSQRSWRAMPMSTC